MKNILVLLLMLVTQFLFLPVPQAQAATSPTLGTAAAYSVLAGSQVTNTGATTISGNVGISPGTVPPNYTGFGTVSLGGSIHDADGAALIAMNDRNAAFTALGSQSCNTDYGAVTKDLAGENLIPGVYCADSFHLTGTLILNGSASDVWIFKSASDLVLTGGSAVKMIFTGGGNPCNVWWRAVSTATFDSNSSLSGNILADTSITMAAGASLNGRALARTAEVALSSNSIIGPTCNAVASNSSSTSSSSNVTPIPVCPALSSTIIAPTIITSKRLSATSISVNWGPYTGLDTFNVQYGLVDGSWLYSTDVTGFSVTINNLPANQPIWVRVAARSGCRVGTYGDSKLVGGPRLPNAGFGPHF